MQLSEYLYVPERFSPDNDGFDDYATVYINCDMPGYIANILIFDVRGHKIKTLATNVLMGTHNHLTWDGTDIHNRIAASGIYLLYIELLHAKGSVKSYKKAITLVKNQQ